MGRPNESLSTAEEGAIDPWVRAGSKFALQRRVLRLSKPPRRWKVPSYADYVKRNIREVYITLIVLTYGKSLLFWSVDFSC
jgi:Fanconi-associated nuclease 1